MYANIQVFVNYHPNYDKKKKKKNSVQNLMNTKTKLVRREIHPYLNREPGAWG